MKEEIIEVPRWFLENVENTLRIQNNINLDKKTGETCQDRNVREALNGLRKLLRGEELSGTERLEKLRPELPKTEPKGLDEAAEEYSFNIPSVLFERMQDEVDMETWKEEIENAFKAGTKWMAEQGETEEAEVGYWNQRGLSIHLDKSLEKLGFEEGDKVIIQLKKK